MIAVRDLMTPIGSEASPDDLLGPVIETMRHNSHSCVVVSEAGRVVGLLTERDLIGVFMNVAGDAVSRPVADAMVVNPLCVNANDSLLEALKLARTHKIRHLPVVDDNQLLVGMVTHTDMINVYVDILENQVQLIDDNMHLRAQSLEDPLLGIGNRRAMEGDLVRVAANTRRAGQRFAITLFDLDYFKAFNDHYGHVHGDKALKQVVNTMVESMRHGDSLYRYGGEELLLLMPNTDGSGAIQAAERVRESVIRLALQHVKSPHGILTVSGGIASEDFMTQDQLIAAADKALYFAKSLGRNRTASYQHTN
ncbi:diguanylate cyclase [Cellvibrio polysaccharolyticus]|uniref:diguanylate cyclase n=1 Tax=Cellvibrio polysaccharolyticus TaxID=2082724 RepID=A0A928V6Y9_9GAMM|nr:diguanylate cyclase [Cellvibrio polysaccharolyticus]MBE8718056.1 diguanylate cyclase [Cellvibrio polysaccharolyticus]